MRRPSRARLERGGSFDGRVSFLRRYLEEAAKDPAVKSLINDGVARLDQEANDRHKMPYAQVAWENDRVALLQRIEESAFFQKIRGDLVVSLYNNKEVWPRFGYEGSSAEHGGYIKRGFADIDWLPKA